MQYALACALFFYFGLFNLHILFAANKYHSGGLASLIGLVIKDYVGEDVLSAFRPHTSSELVINRPFGPVNSSLRSLPGCYPSTVPSMIAGFWLVFIPLLNIFFDRQGRIGPLIVESVLFLLVVGRAVSWWMDGAPTPKILKLLTRDSTIYFAM